MEPCVCEVGSLDACVHCATLAGSMSPILLTQLYSVAKGAILSLVHSWLSEWDWWDMGGGESWLSEWDWEDIEGGGINPGCQNGTGGR